MDLRSYIADVPDFPKPGITFRDITPLLAHPRAFGFAIGQMAARWRMGIDAVAALDARGFIFGSVLAHKLELPFVPVRKAGKLPGRVLSLTYDLEYGTDTIEIRADAVGRGTRVLVVDDLLATGGTARAACDLIEMVGAQVAGCALVIELEGLGGRQKLAGRAIQSLVTYEEETV